MAVAVEKRERARHAFVCPFCPLHTASRDLCAIPQKCGAQWIKLRRVEE